MIRLASAALAITLTSAGAALAADLNDPYSAGSMYSPAPVFNWSGAYVGAHLGYGWGDSGPSDTSGFIGGITAGHNWQSGQVVFGLEGDIAYSGIDGSNAVGTYDIDWLGTARGRIGYAFDRFMIFGTGGFAWTSARYQIGATRDRNAHFGWALGAGAEAAITDRVSARLDFLHANFEKENYRLGGAGVSADPTISTVRAGVNYRF